MVCEVYGDEVTRDGLGDGGSVATSNRVGLPEGGFGCSTTGAGSLGANEGDEIASDGLGDGGSVGTSARVGLREGRFGCNSIGVGSVVAKDGDEVTRDGLGDGGLVMISKRVGMGERLRSSGSRDGVNVVGGFVGTDEGCRVNTDGEEVGEYVCMVENDGL